MSNLNFNGLNSNGVATGEYNELIGQSRLKKKLLDIFNSNKVTEGNKDSIIINIFGDWGLGKTHLAFKMFSEINGLVESSKMEIVEASFSNEALCILLNYRFIESFDLKFLPRNIALSAAYWLDEESYKRIGSRDTICFQDERVSLIKKTETIELQKYNNQYSNHKDEDYEPFKALNILLEENNKKRLIVIVDEIEELERMSGSGYTKINISNLYDQLTTFISNASKQEKYKIGFVFLISQEMYDKVREFVEETPTSSDRRFDNILLRRYSSLEMKEFLELRLNGDEIKIINPFMDYFEAIWEASNRNFGWFEIAAKNLCLEIIKMLPNPNINAIEEALLKTKKKYTHSIFNPLAYKDLITRYQSEIVNSYCLKTVPQNLKLSIDIKNKILATCGEVTLKIDEAGDIADHDFSDRLKENKSGIKELIAFENSLGSMPIENIIDSLYSFGKNKFLTYFPSQDFQFHLTWAANRKLDSFFTEKLKASLDMKESSDYFLLSTENRKNIYPYYKENISANWITSKKLRELREFLDS